MIDLWFLLMFIVPLMWALSNVYDKLIVEHISGSNFSFAFYNGVLSSLLFLFFMIIFVQIEYLINHLSIYFVFLGAILPNIFILYAKALEIEESSKVAPLFSLTTIFTLIIELILFNVSISLFQLIGVFIIILGSFLITSDRISINIIKIFKPRKALYLMGSLCLFLAVHFFSVSYFSGIYSFWTISFYIMIGNFIGLLIPLSIKKNRIDVIKTFNRHKHKKYKLLIPTFTNILDYSNLILYNFVLSIAPAVTLVSAIANLQYIYVFLIGVLMTLLIPKLVDEDITKKGLFLKIISIGIIITGVLIIQLF